MDQLEERLLPVCKQHIPLRLVGSWWVSSQSDSFIPTLSQSFLYSELFSSPLCFPVTASPPHNCSLLAFFTCPTKYLPSDLRLSLLLLLTTIPPNIHLLILGSFLQLFVQSLTLPSLLPQAVYSLSNSAASGCVSPPSVSSPSVLQILQLLYYMFLVTLRYPQSQPSPCFRS